MHSPHITKKAIVEELKKNNLMSPLIRKAIKQVIKTHSKQKRDNGSPYIEQHLYPVVHEIIQYYKDEKPKEIISKEIIAGALLHDVLEDDKKLNDNKFISLFGPEVYSIVKTLTKPPHDGYTPNTVMSLINNMVWENVKKSDEKIIIIKLADRTNNMESFFGLDNINTPKVHRYIEEVTKEYLPYTKSHNTYFYQKLSQICAELNKRLAESKKF